MKIEAKHIEAIVKESSVKHKHLIIANHQVMVCLTKWMTQLRLHI